MPAAIQVNKEFFDIAPDEHRIAASFIHKVYEKLGKPDTLNSETSWKLVDAIMKVWVGLCPDEFEDFRQSVLDAQSIERNPCEANKVDGGYFPISYPMRLHAFLKVYFKNQDLVDRKIIKKFISRYPAFKVTRFKI